MRILFFLLIVIFSTGISTPVFADSPDLTASAPVSISEISQYPAQAKVLKILEENRDTVTGPSQVVQLELLNGPDKGKQSIINHGENFSLSLDQLVSVGDTVVVQVVRQGEQEDWWIVDQYRLPTLKWIASAFVVLVILAAGWKGVGSLIGMGVSLLVITLYIVPQILDGGNPIMISLSGSLIIVLTTLYLAHGFTIQTTISLVSTLIALLLTGIFSYFAVHLSQLHGMGSEDAYSLQMGPTQIINLRGLLLGGIILGTVGVLDDITTSQAAAVFELKRANAKLAFRDLFNRAHSIGIEHTASLVNTLVMAYAGTAMPLFIFFVFNPGQEPLWAILNSELVAEEIVRTLAGSIGLILAVPITTFTAAWYIHKKNSVPAVSHTHH